MEGLILEAERSCTRQLQESNFEDYFRLENNPAAIPYISGKPQSWKEASLRFAKQRLNRHLFRYRMPSLPNRFRYMVS